MNTPPIGATWLGEPARVLYLDPTELLPWASSSRDGDRGHEEITRSPLADRFESISPLGKRASPSIVPPDATRQRAFDEEDEVLLAAEQAGVALGSLIIYGLMFWALAAIHTALRGIANGLDMMASALRY